MKTRLFVLSLVLLLPALAEDPKPADVEGSWDLSKPTRKFAASAILRAEGEPMPSFWVGNPEERSSLKVTTEPDLLGELWDPKLAGALHLSLTHTAPKPGLERRLPGGRWMANLKENPLRITLGEFGEFKVRGSDKAKKEKAIAISEGKVAGVLEVAGETIPLQGELRLLHARGVPRFDLKADLSFDLEGVRHTLSLHLPGPAAELVPKL